MMNKIGRNDPCWCGSGLKYKKCHLNRHLETRPTIQASIETFKKAFDKSYCLHPGRSTGNCQGNIIKAHTIQRSGGLSKIAHNQHVYGFKPHLTGTPPSPSILPRKIGINKASTFTGFCQHHDYETFKRIEEFPFVGEIDQIFLFAYRALSREVFIKHSQLELAVSMGEYDKGLEPFDQRQFKEYLDSYKLGVELGVATVEIQKRNYDIRLSSSDYSLLNYYVALIDETPEFLCSGISIIETDFSGKGYNQLGRSDIEQEIITFSIIPMDDGGAIIFASLDNGEDTKSFFQSIESLSEDELPNAIARYTFEYYENTFISPLWWDNLGEDIRKSIIDRYLAILKDNRIRPDNCLLDDGIKIVNWNVQKIISRVN